MFSYQRPMDNIICLSDELCSMNSRWVSVSDNRRLMRILHRLPPLWSLTLILYNEVEHRRIVSTSSSQRACALSIVVLIGGIDTLLYGNGTNLTSFSFSWWSHSSISFSGCTSSERCSIVRINCSCTWSLSWSSSRMNLDRICFRSTHRKPPRLQVAS